MQFLCQKALILHRILNFSAMKTGKKGKIVAGLLLVIIIIKLYVLNAERVETGYSTQFFKHFSAILRSITGIFPFSIGDILYAVFVVWLLFQLFRMVRFLVSKANKGLKRNYLSTILYRWLVWGASLYIVFNLFWGINYNRKGIASQMGLKKITKFNKIDGSLKNSQIFGNTLEALVGAVYLDKGYRKTRRWVAKSIISPYLFMDDLEVLDINIKNKLIENFNFIPVGYELISLLLYFKLYRIPVYPFSDFKMRNSC